ncbi:MAG: hypothetical protein Q8829_02815, partial [Candidatus Phytoplasma australasiaticum]|nr:hypothetical protein [Candidatus Phytoplasma australasiaticum]
GDLQHHEGIRRNSKRLAFNQGKNQKVEDQGFMGSKDWSSVKQEIRVGMSSNSISEISNG